MSCGRAAVRVQGVQSCLRQVTSVEDCVANGRDVTGGIAGAGVIG